MAFKKRRGFKGTWLPNFGTEVGSNPTIQYSSNNDDLILPNGKSAICQVSSLIPDEPRDDYDDTASSLVDFVGTEYALRRIVGKADFAIRLTSGTPKSGTIKVGLGYFVSRCNGTQEDLPVGMQDNASFYPEDNIDYWDTYSPLALMSQRNPWIWRRTWIIQTSTATNPTTAYQLNPVGTWQYGSVMDGPHIDAKTRRRVKLDERLFMSVAACWFPMEAGDETVGSMTLNYDIDVRYFGALRKARGKSAF